MLIVTFPFIPSSLISKTIQFAYIIEDICIYHQKKIVDICMNVVREERNNFFFINAK